MIKHLNNMTKFVSFSIIMFLALGTSTFATEVVKYYKEDDRTHLPRRVFDASLSSEETNVTKAEQILIHVEGANMRDNLALLQKPYYDIDLSEKEIRLDDLRALIPISSQVIGLSLIETCLDNDAFPLIAQLTSLQSLDVSDNRFDDEGVSFSSLANLKSLRIARGQITARTLESLLPLKMLGDLDVGCTRIGNAGIKIISQVLSLQHVNVRSCGFDETVLPLFFALPKLETLNISGNKFEKSSLEAFLSQALERQITVEQGETVY